MAASLPLAGRYTARLATKEGWVTVVCMGAAATEACCVPTYPAKTPLPAWMLAAHPSTKRAVLSVRGTHTENDARIDAAFDPAPYSAGGTEYAVSGNASSSCLELTSSGRAHVSSSRLPLPRVPCSPASCALPIGRLLSPALNLRAVLSPTVYRLRLPVDSTRPISPAWTTRRCTGGCSSRHAPSWRTVAAAPL